MAKKVRIGDKLVEKGYITEDQLKWALSEQKQWKKTRRISSTRRAYR